MKTKKKDDTRDLLLIERWLLGMNQRPAMQKMPARAPRLSDIFREAAPSARKDEEPLDIGDEDDTGDDADIDLGKAVARSMPPGPGFQRLRSPDAKAGATTSDPSTFQGPDVSKWAGHGGSTLPGIGPSMTKGGECPSCGMEWNPRQKGQTPHDPFCSPECEREASSGMGEAKDRPAAPDEGDLDALGDDAGEAGDAEGDLQAIASSYVPKVRQAVNNDTALAELLVDFYREVEGSQR